MSKKSQWSSICGHETTTWILVILMLCWLWVTHPSRVSRFDHACRSTRDKAYCLLFSFHPVHISSWYKSPSLFLLSFASFSHTSRSIAIKALSLSFFCTRPDRFPLLFGSKSVSMLALAIPLVPCPTSRPRNVQLCIRLSPPATARPPSPMRRPATDIGLPRRRMTPHPHPHPALPPPPPHRPHRRPARAVPIIPGR